MARRTALAGLLVVSAACLSTQSAPSVEPAPAGADAASPSSDAATTCALPEAPTSSPYALRFDAAGYLPSGEKRAVVLTSGRPSPSFRIVDAATQCEVSSGRSGPRLVSTVSRAGTPLTVDDLPLGALGAGRYLVVLEDGARFGPIVVSADAYRDVVPRLLAFLAAQRCGDAPPNALHGACHLHASLTDGNPATHSGDGVVVADGFTGSVTSSSGAAVDVEGGWHDAGDHIKFVGTTSFTLAVDLLAVRDHPLSFGASKGPLLAELRRGLDWLVKMLSGPVRLHQVSGDRDHDVGWRVPEADTTTPVPGYDQRPAFRFGSGKGANLLGRSAAALALGAQLFAADAAYAQRLLALAKDVYADGKTRLAVQNPDPPDFYPETSFKDDLALGAALLAQATNDPAYRADALTFSRALAPSPGDTLVWGSVDALAFLETALLFPEGSAERQELAKRLSDLAAPFADSTVAPKGPGAPYRYALPSFGNGSVEESLGAAATCLASRRLGGSASCAEVARAQLHWLFGLNPFGLSFMVGVAGRAPKQLHHALARAANLPLDGAIVGGPTSLAEIRADGSLPLPAKTDAYAAFSTDELVYEDNAEDYIVNEPALDFSAPLVFVLGDLLAAP